MALAKFVETHGAALTLVENGCAVAARDLAPGAVVCASSPAAVLLDSADVCSHCMKRPEAGRGEKLQRCAVCKTSYCSRACQSADWIEHKAECKRLGWLQSELPEKGDFPLALLVSRAVRGRRLVPTLPPNEDGGSINSGNGEPAANVGSASNGSSSGVRVYLHNLQDVGGMPHSPLNSSSSENNKSDRSHSEGSGSDGGEGKPAPVPSSPRIARIVTALRSADLLPDTIQDDVGTALANRVAPNLLPVYDSLLVRRGAAVAPLAAQLRHSCAPNCVATFVPASAVQGELGLSAPWSPSAATAALVGPDAPIPAAPLVLVVRAIAPVAAGQPLTLARCDVSAPHAERQKQLKRLVAGTPAAMSPSGSSTDVCPCAACAEDEEKGEDYGSLPPSSACSSSSGSKDADCDLARLFASSASEIAADPAGKVTRPTVDKLRASGFGSPSLLEGSAPPGQEERTRLKREIAILAHSLALLARHLPPFHPDVMRLIDRLYAASTIAGEYACAAPVGYHQVGFHAHALRRCPGHPAVGLQRLGLADLLMNVAIDRAAHYEEQQQQASTSGEASTSVSGNDDHGGSSTSLSLEPAALLRRVCALPPDAPSPTALPEELFAASKAQYQAAVSNLKGSLGPSCPHLSLAEERIDMLGSIVEEAAQRAAVTS